MPRTKRPKPGAKARTGQPSDVRITIRLDPNEAAHLQRDAERLGAKSLSDLIRSRALGMRRRERAA